MFLNQITVIATIPFLAEKFSPSLFGIVSISLILIQTGWIISDWGIISYAIENWRNKNSILEKNIFITNLLASKISIAVLYLSLIGLLIACQVIKLPLLYFIAVIFSTISGAIHPYWFFNLNKINNSLVNITIVSRVSFLFLVFSLVDQDGGLTFMFLHVLSFSVITIYSLFFMIKRCNFSFEGFETTQIFFHIRKSTNFFANNIANNHINMIWSFLLSVTQGSNIIGVYNIAEQGYRAGNAVTNIVANVIRINTNSLSGKKTLPLIYFYICAYFFIALFAFSIVEPVIKFLFDARYHISINILQTLVVVWFFQSCIRFLNYPVIGKILSLKKLHSLSPYIIVTNLLMFSLWFSYSGNILDFAIYFLVTSLMQFVVFIIIINKK